MGPKKRTAIIRRHRRGETVNRYAYTLHRADGGYLSGYATVMGGYAIPTASRQRGKHPAHTWLGRVSCIRLPYNATEPRRFAALQRSDYYSI